ncbi:MAG: hypothetical protein APF81_17695 [Desulfosporosinus sp. BRH_c37]|nr:MAG: hypothetical protein APF81_17695 [Desulfosporosinus sp. BRH_c37]
MEDQLYLLQTLLGNWDSSKVDLLNFYLIKSKNVIKKYCVLTEDEYLVKDFTQQTVELALSYYLNMKNVGLKNSSEGSKSKSFETGDIPASIKATLPSPPIFSM